MMVTESQKLILCTFFSLDCWPIRTEFIDWNLITKFGIQGPSSRGPCQPLCHYLLSFVYPCTCVGTHTHTHTHHSPTILSFLIPLHFCIWSSFFLKHSFAIFVQILVQENSLTHLLPPQPLFQTMSGTPPLSDPSGIKQPLQIVHHSVTAFLNIHLFFQ